MDKCTHKVGGYAETICKTLQECLSGGRKTKKSKGLYHGSIVNIRSGDRLGLQVTLKSGKYVEDGIVLNVCPFCTGQLRDTSGD